MGNIPNKWAARASALGAAILFAVLGFLLAREAGMRLAYGFTFDWYVHPVTRTYPIGEVLTVASLAASAAAFLSVAGVLFVTSALTQWRMSANRFTPPRYSKPVSLDVHFGRLSFLVPTTVGILAPLLGYVVLSLPMLDGQAGITRLVPGGYVLLVALAGALGGLAGGLVASLTTFHGLVSGRLVKHSHENLIARLSLFGMRNAKTTVALVLGVTLVAGAYASSVNTNVDVADVLPRGDPNTDAAHNLTSSFKSSFTQQVTFQLRVLNQTNATQRALYESENAKNLPNRVTEPRPDNVTDELYVRATAELIDWVKQQRPFGGSSGPQDIFKLVNWTIAGGETNQPGAGDDTFSLPGTDREGEVRFAMVDAAIFGDPESGAYGVGTLYTAVDALVSPSWRQTAVLVTIDPDLSDEEGVTAKYIGQRALDVRDEWVKRVERGETEYKVFGPDNPPQFSVDLPIANAHASELTSHDFKILLPVIGVFITVTLFLAFRNATSVIATFSMLAIAVTWTLGAMGAMKIPLNTLNLAVVPLIMGVGIDYGIHMMNEYQEKRAEGKSAEEAWIEAGGGSALALFVGLLTTLAGLVVMVVSPSLLVAQLGILANIALISCYVLATLFIPAVVTLIGGRAKAKKAEFQPSRVMPTIATAVSRARWGVLVVLLLLAGAAIASASTIHREAFGDPPRNWLESDPLRQEHERAINGFYDTTTDDVKANVLIFEGDVTDPAAHAYIDAITRTLRQNSDTGSWSGQLPNGTNVTNQPSRVIGDTLKDLPFIVRTYLTVQGGVPGAGQYLGGEGLKPLFERGGFDDPVGVSKTYPESQAEIKRTMDQVFDSPLKQFGNIFVDKHGYDMAVTIFSVRAATYEDAQAVWDEVQAAVNANEDLRPEGMQVSFFGNTAINYLFVAKQVPWLTYMSVATNILVIVIVFAFTRNVRTTTVVGALNFLTSALWIGFLPLLDIGLAISLTLPLVFIFAMGSDYGLHLAMRCRKTGDTYATFEGVGKGVLYSFVTTFGAFLVFTQISDLAGRRSMIATAIAIGIVFVTTLLVVPILYPVRKHQVRGGDRSVPVVDSRADAAGTTIRIGARE